MSGNLLHVIDSYKVPGVSADEVWPLLTLDQKASFLRKLAVHLSEIFHLRFKAIGSLYAQPREVGDSEIASEKASFDIGPVVCTTLVRDPDDDAPRSRVIKPNRGPFHLAGDWLASIAEYELAYTRQHPGEALEENIFVHPRFSSQEEQLLAAQASLEQVIDIARVYCGPKGPLTDEFALLHHDFRLSNIHVNPDTGNITGIIDWEATHSAPLWACARMPSWIEDTQYEGLVEDGFEGMMRSVSLSSSSTDIQADDLELSANSTSAHYERKRLRNIFLDSVSEEWRTAYESGRHWRTFQEMCSLTWIAWVEDSMKQRIVMYQKQATQYPGIPLNEDSIDLHTVSDFHSVGELPTPSTEP